MQCICMTGRSHRNIHRKHVTKFCQQMFYHTVDNVTYHNMCDNFVTGNFAWCEGMPNCIVEPILMNSHVITNSVCNPRQYSCLTSISL